MTQKQIDSFPSFVRLLARFVNSIHWLFDKIYHSKFNPLYRSGTLTIGLLFVLLVTGLYLILFYKVGAPYESVEMLQASWLGSWMRAVHRYATDLVILTMCFHVMQILALGKTWGPRVLAWVSGLILCGAMFLSAWTGYVMVWDRHGQLVALAGAEMLGVFPFLRDSALQAFSGSRAILGSFFFMNLFLHVALPLGMLAGLWIHTARISRTAWFPSTPVYVGIVVSLCLLGIAWPAPLPGKADLLLMTSAVPTDIFAGFWLPLWYNGSGLFALLFWVSITLLGLSIPLWWRPKSREPFAVSGVDEDNCLGCGQCSRDCPHEAITMKKRDGKIPFYSFVDPQLCVSCGICTASCDDFAIGPEGRKAEVQAGAINDLVSIRGARAEGADPVGIVVYACECNGNSQEALAAHVSGMENVEVLPMECCGNVHADLVEVLLESKEGVFIWGCPERNCCNRDGVQLLRERLYENRHPTLKRRTDKRRVRLLPASPWEFSEVKSELQDFTSDLKNLDARKIESDEVPVRWFFYLRSAAFSVLSMAFLAYFSAVVMGPTPEGGLLRLSFVSPKASKEHCRQLTEAEKKAQPSHMQKKEICERVDSGYRVIVEVEGVRKVEQDFVHGGLRADRPVMVNSELPLSSGSQSVTIHLQQIVKEGHPPRNFTLTRNLSVEIGKVYLVDFNQTTEELRLTSG
jgi:coenzyme F420-reducing hydrogenase delta subunit/NAD-dependent dihydropyrimidine dehydrogenase PreA subunit